MTVMFLAAISVGSVVVANYLIPLLIRQRQVMRAAKYGKGYLCLTYDDGPDQVLTNSLVRLLEEEKAKATFFFVGFRTERNSEICQSLLDTQHEVGCHTYWHSHQWQQLPCKALDDVRNGYARMKRWLSPLAPFRPAYGKIQLMAMMWLMAKRVKVLWWTHNSGDTHRNLPDPQEIVDEVRCSRGGVILMHSFHKDLSRRSYVLEVTSRLIDLARDENLIICTASEYLEAIRRNGNKRKWFINR